MIRNCNSLAPPTGTIKNNAMTDGNTQGQNQHAVFSIEHKLSKLWDDS